MAAATRRGLLLQSARRKADAAMPPSRHDPTTLVQRMFAGDRLALARLITLAENRSPAVPAIMGAVHGRGRQGYVVGVTGPPGAGKSTLVDRLTSLLRAEQQTVGVVAVDPSSPFTGGAVLGDRIRMQSHALDPGVFIRSMATRGSLGGLARATGEVVKLLAAFGHDWVLVETVGVGQSEFDIMKLVDTVVVMLVPESGDAVQTMKAGLMEVADIFVVNKADRAGAHGLMAELKFAVHLQMAGPTAARDVDWETPVLAAEAQTGSGVAEVLAAIRRHRATLETAGILEQRRRTRRRREFEALVVEKFRVTMEQQLRAGDLAATSEQVADGTLDPYSAAEAVLRRAGFLTGS
jgi:LAO/AO transport system kinase